MLDIGEPPTASGLPAGIRKHLRPASLVGRLTVMVANLARADEVRHVEGMVLAASTGDDTPACSSSPRTPGAQPGMRVRVTSPARPRRRAA